MQRGVLGSKRRRLHRVCGRKIQGHSRRCYLHSVRGGKIQGHSRGCYLHRLRRRHVLRGGGCFSSQRTSCPANSQSSSASTVCVCMTGCTGPDGGPCVACAVGKYKGIAGTDACQVCATSKTTSAEQSVSVTQCVCEAGFGLSMTTPGTCPGGQFVPFTGASSCSTCVNDKTLNESKLFEIESRVNSLFASTSSEFFSHAPFLYVEGMLCQTDLTGLYFLQEVLEFNSLPIYKKVVSDTTDQENIGNSLVQIAYSNGNWVVNDLRGYYRVALKGTQWSLCTGAGCPADATNPSSVAIWTELRAAQYVQNSEITMTPSYYLITDALTISQFAMCKTLRFEICVQRYCNPGHRQTLSQDACSQCDPSYYYIEINRYQCSKCAGGLYSAAVGATGIETCEPCEADTWSEEGSPT
jgi:hypothetical protein